VTGAPIKALHSRLSNAPYVLSVPEIAINGHSIEVKQSGTYTGPPPPPMMYCLSESAALGQLSPGVYDLSWEITTNGHAETFRSSFTVGGAPAVPTLRFPADLILVVALALGGALILKHV
jgi:hypothetical protein